MKRHNRLHIRIRRRYYIRRRLSLWHDLNNGYMNEEDTFLNRESWYEMKPGRWSKWNGVCSCVMCRARKYRQDRSSRKNDMDRVVEVGWYA